MPAEILNKLAASLHLKKAHIAENPASEFSRWKFAISLPIIDINLLPSHERTCPICADPYNTKVDVAGPYLGHETATQLPCCKSIVGFHCARDWLLSHNGEFTFCPFCETGYETSAGTFQWQVSTEEEVLPSGMAELALRDTDGTEGLGNDGAIDSVSSSSADKAHALYHHGNSTLLITDPEGGESPQNEEKVVHPENEEEMVQHITIAEIAGSPGGKAKKSSRPRLKSWSALAAAKVAEKCGRD